MNFFSRQLVLATSFVMLLLSTNANAGIIYDFDIEVTYDGLSDSQIDIFEEAEAFWEEIIIGYNSDWAEFLGLSLTISASSDDIDGVGGVLGQAGWTSGYSLEYDYATEGVMYFDTADIDSLEASGSLLEVIIHEMAHVIGFGTLWSEDYNDLLNDDGNYVGEYGLAGYQIDSGDFDASYVPVEDEGGTGTAGAHWDETYGGGDSEIMTGWLDADTTISLATIYSFADLGYIINPDYYSVEVPEPSTLAIFSLALLGLRTRRTAKV